MKYPIPSKSTKAFEWLIEKNIKPRNPGLIFDRFSPDLLTGNDNTKHDALVTVRDSAKMTEEELFKQWNDRWERLVNAAGAQPFTMQTDWRLIAGLGKKGSLEVGFTFHRYGFPYLPGSSLKGLARAYGLLEIASLLEEGKLKIIRGKVAENNHKKPDEIGMLSALDTTLSRDVEKTFKDEFNSCEPDPDIKKMAEAFRYIFGTTERAGKAIFFDAIPSGKSLPVLDLDIMNPHYPDYYNDREGKEGNFPTNWQNPNPVKFLTVAPGTVFRFAIGWRRSPEDTQSEAEKHKPAWSWFKGERITKHAPLENHPRMQKLARRWLQGGLLDLGAGGKTSAGYGYFKE